VRWRPAPTSALISASITSRQTSAIASRNRSPCSPPINSATTSAAVIIWSSAIVVLLLV